MLPILFMSFLSDAVLKQIVANQQFYQGSFPAIRPTVARASPKARCAYVLTSKVGACSRLARPGRRPASRGRAGRQGRRVRIEVETVTCETMVTVDALATEHLSSAGGVRRANPRRN